MSETSSASRFMTTREVAALIRKKPEAVRKMRERGTGPKGRRIGRDVIYDRADVEAWLAAKEAADEITSRSLAAVA